ARRARSGESTAALMRRVPATSGETVLLPAGTVHALGAGVVIFEIQQQSNITYRFDDWGRVDAQGKSRELHVEEALGVLRPESRPEPLDRVEIPSLAGTRERLVSSPWFELERIVVAYGDALLLEAPESPQTVTCLQGSGSVVSGKQQIAFRRG